MDTLTFTCFAVLFVISLVLAVCVSHGFVRLFHVRGDNRTDMWEISMVVTFIGFQAVVFGIQPNDHIDTFSMIMRGLLGQLCALIVPAFYLLFGAVDLICKPKTR